MKKGIRLFLSILLWITLLCGGCSDKPNTVERMDTVPETASVESMYVSEETDTEATDAEMTEEDINFPKEDGTYSSKEEVATYIHEFGHLPSNFITKKEAQELGWDNKEGNLWEVAPGKSIGGDKFGNREGLLPEKTGRKYYECDIDFEGGFRNGKRIVFSDDGLIYYTEDHYESFELLYGEE